MSSTRHQFARALTAGLALSSALALAGCAPTRPSVTGISPATISVSGGEMTLTGTGLDDIGSVRVDGQPATVTSTSGDKVVVQVPAAPKFAAGTADVAVTDRAGDPVATAGTSAAYRVKTPVDRQLAYALEHWNSYNTAQYGDLNPAGGDCANFVSQTLIARGWTMNGSWYNHGAAASWSPAWGYVPAMDTYFRKNAAKLGLTERSLSDRGKIRVGDIVMFDWNNNDSLDHVQVVSAVEKVGGKIRVKMVGHNEDTDYRDLDTTITVEHPGATGHFWSLSR